MRTHPLRAGIFASGICASALAFWSAGTAASPTQQPAPAVQDSLKKEPVPHLSADSLRHAGTALKKRPPDSTKAGGTDSLATAASADTAKMKKHNDLKDTVHYESDKIDYDAENRILRLGGHAKVHYQNITLIADTIVYTMNENLFTATGKPELIEDADTTVGEFMVYNIKTKRGRVRYATTHVEEAYFYGQKVVKSQDDQLYVDQGDYTTCSLIDTPHYFFYGEGIRLIPNQKIICKPAILDIGDAPVAVLPYFIFPIERNRKSGILTPVWGGNPAGGGYVDNVGYYWAPNDYVDVVMRTRIREFSEFVAEAASQYALKYRLNGSLSARYAFNSDFLQSQRQWAIDYSHNQNLTPDGLTKLSGRGNLVSARNFYSRFSEDSSQLAEQLLTSNLTLSKQFQDIKASGSMVWNQSHDLANDHIVQDIPSFSFSLFDRPLIAQPSLSTDNISASAGTADTTEARWFNNIYWGYSTHAIMRSDAWGSGGAKSFLKPGMSHELHVSAPQRLFKYITVSPNASANLSTFYGYMDTTVKGYDTMRNTIIDTMAHVSDTSKFSGYKIDTIITNTYDSLGNPDTNYIVKMEAPPVINTRRDTVNNALTNVLGWQTGVSMSTNLYGILPLHILNFAGIRHTITPSISYTYVPKHDLDKMFYPIGISPEGAHAKQQVVSISLANQFHGKIIEPSSGDNTKPQEIKFPILSWNLSTSYDFEKTGQKWSDLGMSASTAYHFLGVNYNSAFWVYDQSGNLGMPMMRSYSFNLSTGSFSASGKFWDGDRLLLDSLRKPDPVRDRNTGPQAWQFSITPAYSFSASRANRGDAFIPTKNYNLSASANIGFTRNWKISWTGNYNFVLDQMVQNSINISCDLECWDMRFQWRPEKLNPGYYFIVNVKKIPEIKWEQRNND